MAQHNTAQREVAQNHSDTKTHKSCINAFKRREPLTFSSKRKYALAVIAPLQKHSSSKTDDASSEMLSPAYANNRLEEISIEIPRRTHRRLRSSTHFQPFSFDSRDSAQKVERERRLQEMRQMQEQLWSSTFKAHPVRRYKPLIQPSAQSKTRSQQSK